MMKERIKWLDIIKGITIMCVVFEHACERSEGFVSIENRWLYVLRTMIITLQMALFFSVSGFLYSANERIKLNSKSRADLVNFLHKKTMDIFVPYLILGILIWVGKSIFSGWVKHKVFFADLALILVRPIAFAWFLYALYLYEIISGLLDYISPKYSKYIGLVVGGV